MYNVGTRNERNNLEVVEQLCLAVDAAFESDAELAERFPAAPPALGALCSSRIRFAP